MSNKTRSKQVLITPWEKYGDSGIEEVLDGIKNQDRLENDKMEMEHVGENNLYGENHSVAKKENQTRKMSIFSRFSSIGRGLHQSRRSNNSVQSQAALVNRLQNNEVQCSCFGSTVGCFGRTMRNNSPNRAGKGKGKREILLSMHLFSLLKKENQK